MKVEFTRKEVIHEVVRQIRMLIFLSEMDRMRGTVVSDFWLPRALSYSRFLFRRGILNIDWFDWLNMYILCSFERVMFDYE